MSGDPSTLWGAGFATAPSDVLWRGSVDRSDRRLLDHDIRGSQAHVAMLGERGILPASEVEVLQSGLAAIAAEAEAGRFGWQDGDEDVHTAVERRLVELVGDVGGKLHTGRSRNDQVCLDLRLYLTGAVDDRIDGIRHLVRTLMARAGEHIATVAPAYTHLQQAQAVPFGHHLLAYAWMLRRDAERLTSARQRIAVSPLGAGAVAGSSLPLDPEAVADRLGLPAAFANSIDAVASRDFVAEFVFGSAQAMVHLSRLAEEIVLWSTVEHGWVSFDDALVTGSSALPQKKNPDLAELVRGRAATVLGDVAAVLALQKGLPLAYNRDLQEDKALAFHADDTLAASLEAMTALVAGARFEVPAPDPSVTAVDLAEVLVSRGVAFRRAHAVVGDLVARLVSEGRRLDEVTADELIAADPWFVPADVAVVDPARSVEARRSPGGGSPAAIVDQLGALEAWLAGD